MTLAIPRLPKRPPCQPWNIANPFSISTRRQRQFAAVKGAKRTALELKYYSYDGAWKGPKRHETNPIGLRRHVVRRLSFDVTRRGARQSFAESGVPVRRGVFSQIESAGTGLGTRPQGRGSDGSQHFPPLVHVGVDRERAGPLRLARLRPDGGTRRPEPHQDGYRRNHQRRTGVDVGQIPPSAPHRERRFGEFSLRWRQ